MRMSEDEYAKIMERRGVSIPKNAKKPKYHNKRTIVDGIHFDSQKEADYYGELKLRLQAGEIKGFCRQPEFILIEGFGDQRPETYRADFVVFHLDGTTDVIDTKGVETETFKIKKKQFREKFPGLELQVVK